MENSTAPSTPLDAPKVVKIGRFQFTLNVVLQAVIFVAIVAMINVISRDRFVRADWSRNHKFTLSTPTKALLAGLDKPVQVIVCAGIAGRGQNAEVESDAQELLREYSNASKGRLTVEMVNLGANFTRGRELQTKYKFGESESVIIIDYDGRNKFVYSQDLAEYEPMDQMAMMQRRPPQMINFKGEQVITSALLELIENKQNTVYLATGHKEYDLTSAELGLFREELERQNIKLASLTLANLQAVPEDAKAVAIIGPRFDYSERDLKLLSDYWDKKGRLLVCVGPSAGKTPNLDGWLADRGVQPQQDLVINVQSLGGLLAQVPLVGILAQASAVTKEIEGAGLEVFGYMQSLKLDRTKERTEQLQIRSVMASDPTFWGEVDYTGGKKDTPVFDPKRDHPGPLDLGAVVEKGASQDPNVKLETARLVVFGGGDFLTDRGFQMAPVGSVLLVNTFNYLLSREALVGIPPKAKERATYSLSEDQLAQIARAVCLYIPLSIGILGLFHLWWRNGKNLFTLVFWLAVGFLAVIIVWYGLLVSLGVEGLKNIPVSVSIAIGVAVMVSVAAFLMHAAEHKKKVAAKV